MEIDVLILHEDIFYENPWVIFRKGWGGVRQAKCHVVVAQTQGYHLVCIWGCLVKFQRVELF